MKREFETTVTVRITVRGNEEIEDGITYAEYWGIVDEIQESCLTLVESSLISLEVADIECGTVDLSPGVNVDDSERFVPVPAECWTKWRGYMWATDGAVLVREDCPLPKSNPRDYSHYWRDIRSADLDTIVGPLFDDADVGKFVSRPPRSLANRMGPIIGYADDVLGTLKTDDPVILRKGGENVGIVMPLRDHPISHDDIHGQSVDCYGNEISE